MIQAPHINEQSLSLIVAPLDKCCMSLLTTVSIDTILLVSISIIEENMRTKAQRDTPIMFNTSKELKTSLEKLLKKHDMTKVDYFEARIRESLDGDRAGKRNKGQET